MNIHLGFPGALLLATGALVPAHAAIVYSGPQNIPIPTDIEGVYLNLDNASYSFVATSDWDVNPFYGGSAFGYEGSFRPLLLGEGLVDDPILRFLAGEVIDATPGPGSQFAGGFGGSGWPTPHMGAGANQFANGSPGFIGFQFTTDSHAGPFYGWMQVVLTDASQPGLIIDWAYEDSGAAITVGVVPETSPSILLGLALPAFVLSRRRR